ncbi:uncharacterized protein PV09_01194 [Verruconis gallopava]|uniref:Calcium-dependent phosphotriesterase n=1 Tax=Verruconis gallopava TaxID=253628 RepID=A0A0D2BAC0_9PEZI|nr:uncharacterized protein PV09_01194 [Verruconis gallopava]KIW08274.1 hypothetical protein PV09_01194 [Verruconis gallopava]
MPTFRRTGVVVFTLLALHPILSEVLYPLTFLIRNHPRFLKTVNELPKHKIKWQNDVRNCEDVVLDESSGTAIFSCDPGRDKWNTVMGTFISATDMTGWIYYYQYAQGSLEDGNISKMEIEGFSDEKKAVFHPLGMAFLPETRKLYVINHGEHPPGMEIFKVNDATNKLTYERTVKNALMRTPNSVLPISEHEIYFTNDHYYPVRENKLLSMAENFLKIARGNVVYMNLKTQEAKIVAQVGFANGIARLNSTHIALASTTGLSVYVFEIGADHELHQTLRIECNFWVDNLKTDANGKLLITGHPQPLLLEKVGKEQHKYNLDAGRTDGLDPAGRPHAPSWVAEWDGNAEGKIKNLYIGSDYGMSTSTVRDVNRGVGFIVGLYERGILQFQQ